MILAQVSKFFKSVNAGLFRLIFVHVNNNLTEKLWASVGY